MNNRTIKNTVVVKSTHCGTVEIHGDENGALPQDCGELLEQLLLGNQQLRATEGDTSVMVEPREIRIYSLQSSSISAEKMTLLVNILQRHTMIRSLFLKNCDTDFCARVTAELEKGFIFSPEWIDGHLNIDDLRAHMSAYITSTHLKFRSKLGIVVINNKRLDGYHWLLKAWLNTNANGNHVKTFSILAMYLLEILLAQCKKQVTPELLARIQICLDIVTESSLDAEDAINFVNNCFQFISYHRDFSERNPESNSYWMRARKTLEEIKSPASLELFSAWLFLLKQYQSWLHGYLSKENFVKKNTHAVTIQEVCFYICANLIDFAKNDKTTDAKTLYQELRQHLCSIGNYFDELQQNDEYNANPRLINRVDFTPSERAKQCYRSANTVAHALIQTELDTKRPDTDLFNRLNTLVCGFFQNDAMPIQHLSVVLLFINKLLSASNGPQIIDDFFANKVTSWKDEHDDYTTLARLMDLIINHTRPLDILPNCLLRTYVEKYGCERLKKVCAPLVSQVFGQYLNSDVLSIIFNKYSPRRVVENLARTSKNNENPWNEAVSSIGYWQRLLARQYPRFMELPAVSCNAREAFKNHIIEEEKQLRLWAQIFSHELSEEQLAYLIAIRHGDLTRVAKFPYGDIDFFRLIYKSIIAGFTPQQKIMARQLDRRFVTDKSIINWVRDRDDQEMLDLLYIFLTAVLKFFTTSGYDVRKNIIHLATITLQNYDVIKTLMAPDITLSTSDELRYHANVLQIIMSSGNYKVVWQIIDEYTQGNKLDALKLLLAPPPVMAQPNQAPQIIPISLNVVCGSRGDSLRLVKYIDELFPQQRNMIQGDGMAAITLAVWRGKLDVVAYLLERGIEWEGLRLPNRPPLALRLIADCIRANNLDMARTLINGGAPCTLIDLFDSIRGIFISKQPISTKTMATFIEVILLLYAKNPACLEQKNASGDTPLMMAVIHNIPVIETLIKLGANIDARDASGLNNVFQYMIMSDNHAVLWQIIDEYVNNNQLEELKRLLSPVPEPLPPNQPPRRKVISLHAACSSPSGDDSLKLVKCPEQRNIYDIQNGLAIEVAVRMNKHDIFAYLFASGIDWQLHMFKSPHGLISECVKINNLNMARTLIDAGVLCTLIQLFQSMGFDPNQIKEIPDDVIACLIEVIFLLYARNPDCIEERNAGNKRPLIYAAQYGIPVIETLIKLNANINACDHLGETPLFKAVTQRQINSVRELLKYKPNYLVKKKINNQDSVVDVLSYFLIKEYPSLKKDKSFDIDAFIRALVEAQYDINVMGHNGDTPLWHAVRNQEYNVVAALLDCGANINQCYGQQKMTILHYALISRDEKSFPNLDIIRLLVSKSPALINAPSVTGLTPLALAQRSAYDEIVDYLKKASASMLPKPNKDDGEQNQVVSPSKRIRIASDSRLFTQSPAVAQTGGEDLDAAVLRSMPGTS